jgi:hypothetical protein
MRPRWTLLGALLLGVGLLLHLLSARAIGGSYVAYRDHIFGFVVLTLVSGAIIAGLGWRFWKGRHDITLLILGAVQTIVGVMVYVNRFSVHG